MNQSKTNRVPAALYAVAGAGDLAYRQLRKLPKVVTEFTDRAAATLRAVNGTADQLRDRAATAELDLDRLRALAARNRAVVVAGAQTAGERATALYGALVAHGERVVGSGVVQAAEVVNADMEATEAPAAVTAAPARPVTEPTATRPGKRGRPKAE